MQTAGFNSILWLTQMDLKGLQPHRCHQGYSDQDFLPQNMELQSFPGHFLLALFSETSFWVKSSWPLWFASIETVQMPLCLQDIIFSHNADALSHNEWEWTSHECECMHREKLSCRLLVLLHFYNRMAASCVMSQVFDSGYNAAGACISIFMCQ